MTPAVQLLRSLEITHQVHSYTHDSSAESYGLEAAAKLGLPAEKVFKTLVVETERGTLAVAILPVALKLNLKACARALAAKKVTMAAKDKVQRSTGYVLGGVSPLGQKKMLPTCIDISAKVLDTFFVSAGRRGLEIEIDPKELAACLDAKFATLAE